MRTSTAIPLQLNRVYLPIVGFEQKLESKYESFMFSDVTAFEFIVEALVANSASEIALEYYGEKINDRLLSYLPRTLRRRIKFIDADRGALKLATIIFSPVFEEYHMKVDGHALGLRSIAKEQLANSLCKDIFCSWTFLHPFLLG